MSQMSEILVLSYRLKRGDKFLCFTLFLNFQELLISLQLHVQLRWCLDQTEHFEWTSDKSKLNIAGVKSFLDHVTYEDT